TVGVQAGEVVRVLIVPVVAFLAGPRLAGGTRLGGAPRTPAGTRFLLLIRHGVFVELGYVVDSAAGRVARGTPRPLRHLVLHSLVVVVVLVVVIGSTARPQGAQPQDDEQEDDDDDNGDERDDHGEYTTLGPAAW